MTEISTDPRQAQGEISKDELMRSNEEMENYRMALAYIANQSTDQESRDLAQTALDAGQPQSSKDAIVERCIEIARSGAKQCTDGDTEWHRGFRYAATNTALEIADRIGREFPLSHTRPTRECGFCGGPLPCLTHNQSATDTSQDRETQ